MVGLLVPKLLVTAFVQSSTLICTLDPKNCNEVPTDCRIGDTGLDYQLRSMPNS